MDRTANSGEYIAGQPKCETASRQRSVRLIEQYLADEPNLRPRYETARALRRVARYSNNYDMTSRCNLFCEGCYYFEGDDYKQATEEHDLTRWEALFQREAGRGVTFANFVGAEPALVQDRIALATNYLKRGVIFSNGTVKIDPAIRYTIILSIWGDEDATWSLRGARVLQKALRNYAGDSRARALFTINAKNIGQISEVTKMVCDHGIALSFNYFSPTEKYLEKLAAAAPNDNAYFRFSTADDNMLLTAEALGRIRDQIDDMIETYPDVIFHSHAFNRAVTNPDGIYDVDPATNIARNCSGKHSSWHQTHRVDLQRSNGKCCTPNTNCSTCRLSSISLSSFMFRLDEFAVSRDRFVSWLAICEQWGRGHLLETDEVWQQPAIAPQAAQPVIAPHRAVA
jgi:hypothetical protein